LFIRRVIHGVSSVLSIEHMCQWTWTHTSRLYALQRASVSYLTIVRRIRGDELAGMLLAAIKYLRAIRMLASSLAMLTLIWQRIATAMTNRHDSISRNRESHDLE